MASVPSSCCFLAGTLISTLLGARPVEALKVGDLVVTETHGLLPIRWIGTRSYLGKLLHQYDLQYLMPVCVRANALQEGSPGRDLFLSPEHRIRVGDGLVEVGLLTNAMSITRCAIEGPIRYFHIQLPHHSLIFANGAPAESFVGRHGDGYNKFTNVNSFDESFIDGQSSMATAECCLPVHSPGEVLDGIHAKLLDRAGKLGFSTTMETNLRLAVDGKQILSNGTGGEHERFTVPKGSQQVRILSRSVAPAEVSRSSHDRRQLGVCLAGLSLRNAVLSIDIAPGYRGFRGSLAGGFHDIEEGAAGGRWRWTNGNALVPSEFVTSMNSEFELEVRLLRSNLRYPTTVPMPP